MNKNNHKEVGEDLAQKITDYVYKNYSTYYNKTLIIKDCGSHYKIIKHKDGGPLILGKEIV